MTSQIRTAILDDSSAMAELESLATAHPWTETQYVESIGNHRCLLLEQVQELIGLLIYSCIVDEVELLNIVVHPQYQGQGHGKKLLRYLIDTNRDSAQKIFLEVRESNVSAIGLYNAFHFRTTGIRKDYYRTVDGRENALMMMYEYSGRE